MEESRVLKTQRKSVLTRHINTLKRLLIECDSTRILERLEAMRCIFDELEEAHYAYLDAIIGNTNVPADEAVKCEAWFDDVTQVYTNEISKAHEWLNEHGIDTKPSNGNIVSNINNSNGTDSKPVDTLSKDLATFLSLPKVEMPTFNGNPREYHTFITTFDQIIGNALIDDQAKLTRLLQYLIGDAAAAVKSCLLVGGIAGYSQARNVLKSRFGNSQVVMRTVIDDLKHGSSATKGTELRKLADDVASAFQTLTKLGACGEINNQQFIQDVLIRCHPQVRSRWRKYALDTFEAKQEYPSFKLFVDFIEKVAREACDPVYGYDVFKVSAKAANVNFVTHFPEDSPAKVDKTPRLVDDKCTLCKGSHFLTQCDQFKTMNPEQRFQFARKNRLCFGCLSCKHILPNCQRNGTCPIDGCERKHSKWLHVNYSKRSEHTDVSVRNPQIGTISDNVNSCSVSGNTVYLPMVPVLINEIEPAIALLDTGSSCTLISEKLADKLQLQSRHVSCMLKTVGSIKHMTKLVSFNVSAKNDKEQFTVHHACIVPDIPADIPALGVTLTEYPHLADLPLYYLKKGAKADLIIGQDNADLLIPLDVRQSGKANQPYATRTRLGWALQGPIGNDCDRQMFINNHVSLEQIDEHVKSLWDIECVNETVNAWSVQDRQVYDDWRDKSVHDGDRYTIPPAWRPGKPCFPYNLSLAKIRLQCTMKKLHKTGMFDAYDEGIQKLVADGHAELVPLELLDRNDGAVWYLPHHAVLSASKPGKLRIVFDCAAKYGGVSLNSECYRGPDLMNKLLHVLLRFRQYEYAVTADICAMYLQVRIPVADRDCLRFLWLKNDKVFHYRMTSHLFGGVWCASSSTYALRRTLDDFGATDLVRDAVCKSMYVDDLLRSLVSKDDISQLIRDVKMTLEKGGFSLTKFIVNDRHLLSEIPEEDRAQEVKVIKSEHNSKALGIRWDVNHDQFSYIRKEIDIDQVITKRHMLSLVAAMYDPLGLVVPIIILGRMLFQQATKLKLTWDEPVPPDLFARWMSWWGSLCDLSSLVFMRCIVPSDYVDGAIELHHFCDGSQDAYGVCTYVRILSKSGSIHVQLLMAKARLTPVHPITIPRTELCAAVMAVKVEEVLRNELELHLLPSTFWSDSQAVLHYIASDAHRFRVFVANRVSFIRSKTRVEQWHHIRSEHNPADILSRGCTPKTLPDIWKKGPDFLRRHRDSWPLECSVRQDLGSDDLEIKKSFCATSTVTVEMENPLDKLISYHSDYYRLRIAVAWLLRWLNMLRGTKNGEKSLMLGELRQAEDVLIKRVQFLNYADEIQSLQDGKPVKKSSHIASLDPILTDGKLVVGGRLKHAMLSYTARHPVILPPRHKLSKLVLCDAHNRAHLGTEWVLSNVRGHFWIPGARNTLHTIRRECMTCQKCPDVRRWLIFQRIVVPQQQLRLLM